MEGRERVIENSFATTARESRTKKSFGLWCSFKNAMQHEK
jgi:hypothetical protein